jgi:hypothetical protein
MNSVSDLAAYLNCSWGTFTKLLNNSDCFLRTVNIGERIGPIEKLFPEFRALGLKATPEEFFKYIKAKLQEEQPAVFLESGVYGL